LFKSAAKPILHDMCASNSKRLRNTAVEGQRQCFQKYSFSRTEIVTPKKCSFTQVNAEIKAYGYN